MTRKSNGMTLRQPIFHHCARKHGPLTFRWNQIAILFDGVHVTESSPSRLWRAGPLVVTRVFSSAIHVAMMSRVKEKRRANRVLSLLRFAASKCRMRDDGPSK